MSSAEEYLKDTALEQLSQLPAKLTVLNNINVDSAALTDAQVEQLSGFITWASYAKNHVSLAALVSTRPDIQDGMRKLNEFENLARWKKERNETLNRSGRK
ncbi:hypothetical protein F4774DRAFT_414899 [Daldinia eschscholtzii]|nr:hypothetical protein F4774DRAFT_414899 [Daldinia eschscholtzii]